jgi:transposase
MEKLPDRQAAESMRMRIDWKYALHLPLTYAGFDYSVLSEFRDRLIEHEAEGRVFETLVQAFQAMGLVKVRGKQRTDSTAMLTKVRRLSRLELVVETLRLAVGAMITADRQWSEALIPPSWEQRYGERFVMQRYSEKEWQEYEAHIGEDGQWLLSRVEEGSAPADVKELAEVQILKTVWAQQFRETQGKIAYQELKKYNGHTQIQTPHDPEARYSRKRRAEWVGDKVQLTETDDEGYPHLITDIVGTGSNHTDYEELSPIQQRLEKRQCQPGEHYVDAGYMSGPNLKDSQVRAIDLIGPLPTIVTPQDRLPEGITQAQFQVDIQNMCVTCPQGLPLRTPPRWVTACVFSSRNRSVLLVNYALGVVQEKRVELSGSAPIMNKSGQLAADKKPKPSKRTTIFTIVAWKAPGPPWCAVMAYG